MFYYLWLKLMKILNDLEKYIDKSERCKTQLANIHKCMYINAKEKGLKITAKEGTYHYFHEFCEKFLEWNKKDFTEDDLMHYTSIETDMSIVEWDSARWYITDFLIKKWIYSFDK